MVELCGILVVSYVLLFGFVLVHSDLLSLGPFFMGWFCGVLHCLIWVFVC